MTIFYTIASAMLMSSHVSATSNIQRLPSVRVQAESVVDKVGKSSLERKKGLTGPKKAVILASFVITLYGLSYVLTYLVIRFNEVFNRSEILAYARSRAQAASEKI